MVPSVAPEVLAANSSQEIARRIERLRKEMAARSIDIFYVGLSSDLEYLTGVERPLSHYGKLRFWAGWIVGAIIGPSGLPTLMVTRHLTNGHLNELGAPIQNVEMRVVSETDDPCAAIADEVRRQLGGEPHRIALNTDAPVDLALNLQGIFPTAELGIDAEVLPTLRAVKSNAELAAMAAACALVDQVFEESLQVIRSTMTEIELAKWIDSRLMDLGAIGTSFRTDIWTMGPTEVRPVKERVSQRSIGTNTSLNFDYGAGFRGYCSDFGRTVYMGSTPDRYREAYALVIACQEAGARALKPGVPASEVDRTARKVIQDAGYGEWFWHRLGHAIGKDTHESPFLDVVDDTPLQNGMCFTIEPSIFIPGEFGCRVEDVFVVTPGGGKRLNKVTTELRAL
jgi:Xaa-Pro aminopeptidase